MERRGAGVVELQGSWRWGAVAAASLVALAWWAPSGLYLLGFLGAVIVIHEAGHLVVARRVGMRPTAFFWGFGPEIVAVQRGDCRYGLKAIFGGGYVKLEGMTPSSELPDGYDEAGTYRAAGRPARLATILAGPTLNLVTAAMALAMANGIEGMGTVDAARTGVADVWFVVSGTGQALWTWVVEIEAYLRSLLDPSGATMAPVRFMSPVAQASVSGWAVDQGLVTSLRWFGVLSVAVGAVNLLPLPPLDGAHAVVAAAEGVWARIRRGTGRPVRLDVTRLLPLAYLTVAVLVFLSVTALVMDIRDVT